jgi:hypothetical protein
VRVCGTQLCLDDQPWRIHGATAYGQYDDPANEVALAKSAGVNLLEIVEYETQYHSLADAMSEATWNRVDRFIAAAGQNGIHVMLNFSSFGQALMAAGIKPTTYDWQPFLSFVARRINTATGLRYADDPTIAKVELYGEIDAPNYSVPLRGTTAETTSFFSRTLGEWRALDPHHVVSTGGFSYLNDPASGIDWKKIVADPNNGTCDVEVNSYPDRNISVPNVSSYCQQLGKPWFLAAWSSCYSTSTWGADDINDWPDDAAMATHAQDMYDVERARLASGPKAPIAAAGSDFWNLANVALHVGRCDIGTQFPQTLTVVTSNAR